MLATINGRKYFFNCDTLVITKVSNGRWSVTYDRTTFLVVGGIQSGGGHREWFVQNVEFFGEDYIKASSMVEAVRLGIQY